jgi:intein/homing endonuclease
MFDFVDSLSVSLESIDGFSSIILERERERGREREREKRESNKSADNEHTKISLWTMELRTVKKMLRKMKATARSIMPLLILKEPGLRGYALVGNRLARGASSTRLDAIVNRFSAVSLSRLEVTLQFICRRSLVLEIVVDRAREQIS